GTFRFDDRLEGPMPGPPTFNQGPFIEFVGPGRPGVDPCPNRAYFVGCEGFAFTVRGHLLSLDQTGNAMDEYAFRALAREHDGAAVASLHSARFQVEPQPGLLVLGPVTLCTTGNESL